MKIRWFVTSRNQELLNSFVASFFETAHDFDWELYVIHNVPLIINWPNVKSIEVKGYYGGKLFNELLKQSQVDKVDIFAISNDDILFAPDWYKPVIEALADFGIVSPGYIETRYDHIALKAFEDTKNEMGVIPYLYGSCMLMRIDIFPKIGGFDEKYLWRFWGLGLMWRLHLRGLKSATTKQIVIQHMQGSTWSGEGLVKAWHSDFLKSKEYFLNKWGYRSYREIRAMYYETHRQ